MVVCRAAKFGCARLCVIYSNTKTTGPILIKITPYSFVNLRIKFERNRPSGSRDTPAVPKVVRISGTVYAENLTGKNVGDLEKFTWRIKFDDCPGS